MIKLYEDVKTKDHDYWEDACDYDKGCPCIICGRPVRETISTKMLRLVCGGNYITDSEDDYEDDLGWFPVGNACYKRFLSK